MPQYRKKPVVIEAWRNLTGDPEYDPPGSNELMFAPGWLNAAIRAGYIQHGGRGTLLVYTLEGPMRAEVGDWIIQSVRGEMYPCKHDIFIETYEKV